MKRKYVTLKRFGQPKLIKFK